MRRKQLVLLALAGVVATSSFAGYKQHVQLCMNVTSNNAPVRFEAGFKSSDFLTGWKSTAVVANGVSCKDHVYSHGPKNITLQVQSGTRQDLEDIKVTPDSSCPYMYNSLAGWVQSDYQSTENPNEFWSFVLTQAAPVDGYKYAFDMSCQHWSN